ncbi:hypothetical protein [Schleiferilactobacillus harbinensis]|uniref:hypothetical protein n=1 Tax=Schleiferilactobacillus harbinensis TaxID=304207 RepID=UPI00242C7D15|nr:hypothetical protein [Schleiferilactobacillus harbinensis]MCI1688080.1 hypothetical protein [Schleiferilactobacillus harbinensis]MCI1782979.1 hypothetical protein [Schleiferilactobacillus harbinensis]MCI1851500.1 hypothetical protein [Schleiferilactobacillus harbinensis]
MKRRSVVLSTMLVAMTLLAACGSGGSDSGGTVAKKNAKGIYSPTLTITAGKQTDENTGKYPKGGDINNNPMIDLGVKELGIKIKTTLLGGDAPNYNTKLRLALTGASKLPDVIPMYDKQAMSDFIDSGKVKEISSDIKNYMPARMKKELDKYPQTYNPVKRDGKIYGFAISPDIVPAEVMFIRQDWLDKLGLKAPTNLAEFGKVIQAFTDNDPDGNGKKDTYGFTYSGQDIYSTGWVSDPVMLFSANAGKNFPGNWSKQSDGQIAYGSIAEGNKKTLETMADWHKKGYLFQEAAATDAWTAMGEFIKGKAGIFVGQAWAMNTINDLLKTNKNARVSAVATIRQDNGEPAYQAGGNNTGYLMFNKDFKNMKAFFDYLNWVYDYAYGTGNFKYGYMKGYDYDIVDGKPQYDPSKYNTPTTKPFQPNKVVVTKNPPSVDQNKVVYEVTTGAREPFNALTFRAKQLMNMDPAQAKANVIAYQEQLRNELVVNVFNGAPTKTMAQKWGQLATLEKQTYTNIIYGKAPLSSFDTFVKEWKKQGGDQVTKEVNDWYKSVNK